MTAVPVTARARVLLQALLPTRLLSSAVHWLAHVRVAPVKNALIRGFLRLFAVDMSEAAEPDPLRYPHFNGFFTRALRQGARPLSDAPELLVSPVDGTMSQRGRLAGEDLVQAKGSLYTAGELIGEDARAFAGGDFCTIYLAPHNYHRVHAPMDLQLRGWRHLPGRLFSVNPATVAARPRLFSRNERVACFFDTDAGPLVMVFVGALLVGSVDLVCAGRISPPHRRSPSPRVAVESRYRRGEEIGRFNMGSTIVLLAAPGVVSLAEAPAPGASLRLGEAIGRIRGELTSP